MPTSYYVEDGIFFISYQDSIDQDSNDEESIDSEDKTPKYDFSELENSINETIQEYDEKVFIKLNWSAPRDANWVVPNLHCDSSNEIYT